MGVSRLGQATLILLLVLACSCSQKEQNVRQNGSSGISSTTVTISAEEVRSLLSSELSISQLESTIGSPVVRSGGNWGNIMYALPNGRYLFFFFKGNFVTGARYDGTEITGVSPKIHKMNMQLRVRAGKQSVLYELDGDSLANIAALKKRLQALPPDSIVEWQQSCTAQTPIEVTNELKQFCSKVGIVLLYYPSG
jgi:hypothetical protein